MSIKAKQRVKNISRVIGIALFALLMFTNIKIATMDNSELAKGDISLFGIEVNLFDATDAYNWGGGGGGGTYYCSAYCSCSPTCSISCSATCSYGQSYCQSYSDWVQCYCRGGAEVIMFCWSSCTL